MRLLQLILDKFREVRTSGLLLAIPLTYIAIRLIEIPDKTEALWLALGVIVGAFATSIKSAFDDSSPPPPAVTEQTHLDIVKEITKDK